MTNTARTATSTISTSGMFQVATYFTDINGQIVSLTSGENEVRKYVKVSPLDVAYKLIVNQQFIFKNYYSKSIYTSPDGMNFTEVTGISGLPPYGWNNSEISYNAGKYMMSTDYGVHTSSDNMHTWTTPISATGTWNPIQVSGNTLAVFRTGFSNFMYSNDNGTTWATHTETIPNGITTMCMSGSTLLVMGLVIGELYPSGPPTYTPTAYLFNAANISAASYANYDSGTTAYPMEMKFINAKYVDGKIYYMKQEIQQETYFALHTIFSLNAMPSVHGWYGDFVLSASYPDTIRDYTPSAAAVVGMFSSDYMFSTNTTPTIDNGVRTMQKTYYDPFNNRFFAVGTDITDGTVNFTFASTNSSAAAWTEQPSAGCNYPVGDFPNSYMGYRLK